MRRVFPIALRRYVSSVTPNKIKEALSHSGIVSVPRWLNFNDSNKSLLDGYVRSNKVHGKFYRRIVQVLKEYVQEATPSIPPSSLISLRDCSKIDEAHRRAEQMFHHLVASRELRMSHVDILLDLIYDVDDIQRIKTYMNLLNLPISEKMFRTEIDILTLANLPYEHVEFQGVLSKRTRRILEGKDVTKRRENRLKSWLLRGTRAREAAWDLFHKLVDSNLATPKMFELMALYGCDSTRDIQNKVLVKINEDRDDKDIIRREVYGALSYRYRLEADTMFNSEYDPIVRKLDIHQQQGICQDWQREHRTVHLQNLLLRDIQSAWLFFCVLDVRRALSFEMCK